MSRCLWWERNDGWVFVDCSCHPVRLAGIVLDLGSLSAVGPMVIEEVVSIFFDMLYKA